MSQASSIEWTDTTWNPVLGCTKVSPGCAHCYAERMSNRLAHIAESAAARGQEPGRAGHYRSVIDTHGRWNGAIYLAEEALEDPYRWRSPRFVFVNSMSDLFHEDVPVEFIERVFRVMNENPQHTFQVLTKRPHIAVAVAPQLDWTDNIWMGTSVENAAVTHRVHDLRRIKARVRFLSVEPLLGPIPRLPIAGIHWVIVGGESGPGARAMNGEWVLQIKDRCVLHKVPFFFKQWGGVNKKTAERRLEGLNWNQMPVLAGGYAQS